MEKYNIILKQDNNDFIILHSGNKQYCECMMKWYLAHKHFFVGDFSIVKESNQGV